MTKYNVVMCNLGECGCISNSWLGVCVCLFVCVTRRFLNEKVVYAGEEREIIACNRN